MERFGRRECTLSPGLSPGGGEGEDGRWGEGKFFEGGWWLGGRDGGGVCVKGAEGLAFSALKIKIS